MLKYASKEKNIEDFVSQVHTQNIYTYKLYLKKNKTHQNKGYKNTSDAEKALAYFNNTYIQMNKISVQYAKTLDDPNLPKTWSKYAIVKIKKNLFIHIKSQIQNNQVKTSEQNP